MEQASKFQLIINLQTAKALGLDVASDATCARRRGDRMKRRPMTAVGTERTRRSFANHVRLARQTGNHLNVLRLVRL